MPEGCVTARFFFNFVSDGEVIRDEKGVDLSMDGDVLTHIARAIGELQDDGLLVSVEWQGWQIEITDSAGQTVLSVPLSHAIPERSSLF